MEKLRQGLPFLAAMLLDFYAVPFLIRDTGTAMVILLIVVPFICFTISALYGVKNGFTIWFALLTAAIFSPSIFIFYNSSAWVYIVGYGIIAFAGNTVGALMGKRNR